MAIFNNVLAGSGIQGEFVEGPIKSLRFNENDDAYLSRTPASAGNRQTWTWSSWVKVNRVDYNNLFSNLVNNDNGLYVFWSGGRFYVQDYNLTGGASVYTEREQFRDFSGWYHIVISYDTTQSAASNRVRIYINGVEETLSGTYPNQNINGWWNSTETCLIGRQDLTVSLYDYNGYMADIYFIDGYALDASSFGSFDNNNVWQASRFSGTYGTNGFHLLDFATESTVGNDSSGNNNDFTANNISTTAGAGNDVLFDVPTNNIQTDTGAGGEVSGNYCTMNSLDANSSITISNGNLDASVSSVLWVCLKGTIGVSSGKWYWETTINEALSSTNTFMAGIATAEQPLNDYMSTSAGAGYYAFDGNKYPSNGSYGATYGINDVIGTALDLDAGTLTFYKNGVSQGQSHTGLTGTWFPCSAFYGSTNVTMNFGARSFAHSAPSGYKALCTANLPTPTIADGSDHFDTVLYTGTDSAQSITGLNFSPDWVWTKNRSNVASHALYDSVRGAGLGLRSDQADAEYTASSRFTSFDNNGFSIGGTSVENNALNNTYVSWAWDAGSSTVSNTDGTITSNVRANQTAGFSIVSYTGTGSNGTVGHGLNAVPDMIILKDRNQIQNWKVLHTAAITSSYPNHYENLTWLNSSLPTTSTGTGNTYPWNGTAPTSSVFSVSNLNLNKSASENNVNYIAYCFSGVENYSQFGSYVGDGVANSGPFVYTGFRPAFLMIKGVDGGDNWYMYESKRNGYNPANEQLTADITDAE